MIPNKIAFVGYAGVGKDYLADYLISKEYQRVAFADSVKKYVNDLFPQIKEYYTHEEKDNSLNINISNKLITLTPREIWINISKPIIEVDSNFFLNKTLSNITKECVIITDVRRKEEFLELKNLGYTIIFIDSNKTPKNDFDKQILDFKKDIGYTFTNNFNGLSEFKQYINNL